MGVWTAIFPYAHGVVRSTAVLPEGWESRLVPFETPGTNGVVARCLEIHDLWISKAIAGRPKDVEFCQAILEKRWVDRGILAERLDQVAELDPRVEEMVQGRIGV